MRGVNEMGVLKDIKWIVFKDFMKYKSQCIVDIMGMGGKRVLVYVQIGTGKIVLIEIAKLTNWFIKNNNLIISDKHKKRSFWEWLKSQIFIQDK